MLIYWEYLKYLIKHKINFYKVVNIRVKKEHSNNIMLLKALFHDMSKFSPKEFKAYSNWFYGKYGKNYSNFGNDFARTLHEYLLKEFEEAVEHHYKHNKHHWNHWIGKDMPYKYVVEMVDDWSAMGVEFGNTAQEYYLKNYYNFDMTYQTRLLTEEVLGLNYSRYCGYEHTLEHFALTYSRKDYYKSKDLTDLHDKYWDLRQFFLDNCEQGLFKIVKLPKYYNSKYNNYSIGDIVYGRIPRGLDEIYFFTDDKENVKYTSKDCVEVVQII